MYLPPWPVAPGIICHALGMSRDLSAISRGSLAIIGDPPSIRDDSLRIYRDPCGISNRTPSMSVDLRHIIPDACRIS
ncbi:MAG: hypothetical protein EOP84_29070 [Verrucomicrobiaceae bacterium]|nr:MAG: hypothetical protein EOP84_29070 [Verrucomicrobiaceae bacterium]